MRYYKIHLGPQNIYAKSAVEQGFIGIDFGMTDLSSITLLPDAREVVRGLYIEKSPNSTRASVGIATGTIFRFLVTIQQQDRVIVPLGDGTYRVGNIISDYFFVGPGEVLPHRRKVEWIGILLRENFSQGLKNTMGAIGTISEVTHYSVEIEALLSGNQIRLDTSVSDAEQSEFALEKHLEDFLIENWSATIFGSDYQLLTDDQGELIGQQYSTEVGPIDILAIKQDKSEILILELKKGRSGDAVVGQMLRYMTAVKKEIADPSQKIRAVILTGQDDKKLRYSLEALDGKIEFMVYKVSFSISQVC